MKGEITVTTVAKLPTSLKRGGAVIYTQFEGELLFCLGCDAEYQTFTDFGGGFSKKRDIILGHCIVRELREESLGVFNYKVTQVLDFPAIHNSEIAIAFIPVDSEIVFASAFQFDHTLKTFTGRLEVDKIEWFSIQTLGDAITNGEVYNKVADLIQPILPNIEEILG